MNVRILAVPTVIAAIALAGCGSSSSSSSSAPSGNEAGQATGTQETATPRPAPEYAGGTLDPARPAPGIKLSDSLGAPFDLGEQRGKAVLVTFIYDHCPDTCPLIVSNLRTAQAKLSPEARAKLQIIAVSVDPEGDTPKTVQRFLHDLGMTGRMRYLIGSRSRLESTWRNWGILSKADPKDPDAVEHSALIYGIAASGKVTTIYPSNFKPADVAHDVPLLERA